MKRHIIFFLIIALLLPGCAGKNKGPDYLADLRFDTDEFLPEYDYVSDSRYLSKLVTIPGGLLYTGDSKMFLNYYDNATGETGVLCSKPECMHNDGSCNGYGDFAFFTYYDGSLWFMDRDWANQEDKNIYLWRSDLSLVNRQKVVKLGRPSYSQVFMHRGYLYMAKIESTLTDEAEPVMKYNIKAFSLDGKNEEISIHNDPSHIAGRLLLNFRCVGNYVYYSFEGKEKLEIYRFDSKTRTGGLFASIDKPSGLMVVRMHITRKNEIYLYGNLNKQGCVWKYENGSMIPTVTFENIDGIYGVRFMTDDTICAMRLGYDAPDSCWIKKYDGTTVQRLDMVSDFLKNIGSDAKKVTNLMYHYACGNENVFYVIGSANAERDDIKEYINFILAYEYDGKEIVSHTVWSQAQPK